MLVTWSCATFTHRTSKDSAGKYQTHLPGENKMADGSGARNETSKADTGQQICTCTSKVNIDTFAELVDFGHLYVEHYC